MIDNYSADDVVIMLGNVDSYDTKDHITITGFADGSLYQSPKLWHTAEQLESGNWKVSVEHKGNRRLDVELSDENYKKYGIDKLEPTIENPFKVDYDDANLIEVINDSSSLGTIDSSDHIHLGGGALHQEGL